MDPEKKTFKNAFLIKRFLYAGRGVAGAFLREASFRLQCACALGLVVFCLVLKPSPFWCALFALASALVLGLELVNTAVEAFLDRFHPQWDAEVGFIKDCLAGAVFIASLGALIVFATFLWTFRAEGLPG